MLLQLVTVILALSAEAEVEIRRDIPYWKGDQNHPTKNKLDLYLPGHRRNYPVLFFVHGGAWMHGDKNFLGVYSAFGKSFASKGVGVVVTNYRLSPSVQHPEHSLDVGRALAWTQHNIASMGGDSDAITLCGHSAGGHLVSLIACSEEIQKECGINPNKIRAVAPISGVYDIPQGFLPLVFGTSPQESTSPAKLTREGLPPFLILFEKNDLKYCGKQPSIAFRQSLVKQGNKAQAIELPNADHFLALIQSFQHGKIAMDSILHLARTGELPPEKPSP